ncbi:MAG: DUF1549 and DUF1553 domain-containing protein, partial [Planctomycetota bacterium]
PTVLSELPARDAIDAFVLTALEPHGLRPSPEADRATLLRRVSLDVLGLNPSPGEVDAFAKDTRPDAYERRVDSLLANPHFGERWGRHWLDQARYADSHGYTTDGNRSMWPYRDWVLGAFNSDLSFDQFTIEQLAGDLLKDPRLDQIVATGFHRNTLINSEGGTKADQFRVEQAKDRIDTTGLVWMGLTVGCAKCHTHKYDPIQQTEYYSMYAFFDSTEDRNSTQPTVRVPTQAQTEELARVDAEIAALKSKKGLAGDAQKRLAAKRKKLEDRRKNLTKRFASTMVLRELKSPRKTHVHIRGDFLRPGQPVQPGVPEALPALPDKKSGANRLDLARWLMREDHPLTARVRVNRIWMRLFGRGLVETEDDFGTQGSPPSHPELLDWLSKEFVRGGWSTKSLIRSIVTSATYRQSSHSSVEQLERDPRNVWLGRQSRIRVEAEIVRDLALEASGTLSEKLGGPSVFPPQPSGVYAFTQNRKNWKTSPGEDAFRRGMYTFFYRTAPHPMLTTFDVPKFNQTCTRRDRSNTPLQSLTVANDSAMVDAARSLAARVLRELPKADASTRIAWMLRLTLIRKPVAAEVQRLFEYFTSQVRDFASREGEVESLAPRRLPKGTSSAEAAAWTATARVVLNLDETITRE